MSESATIDIKAIAKGLVELALNTVDYREALVANGLGVQEATVLAIAFQQQMMQLMAIRVPEPTLLSGGPIGPLKGPNEA